LRKAGLTHKLRRTGASEKRKLRQTGESEGEKEMMEENIV
jgi:hypothetical protein